MAFVERSKNICLKPKAEWSIIEAETTTPSDLITGYVVPLVAIGAIAGLVGRSLIGVTVPFVGSHRLPILAGLGLAIFTFVMAIVGILVLAGIINALAPTFGGKKNGAQSFKVAAYSYTPVWIAGALQILPTLGIVVVLAGLYGLYLLYLGLPRLMRCPPEKAISYTAVVVVCAMVLGLIIGAIGGLITAAGAMGTGARSGMQSRGADPSAVQFAEDSLLGKLQVPAPPTLHRRSPG